MHVAHLSLRDFRSYPELELDLGPGVTSFVGRNGQGKTNIVEAIDYLSSLSSHRVATDAPLVRRGTEQAVVRAAVMRDERRAVLEIQLNPGRSNKARVNSSPLPKARELLGLVRTVVFGPDDLALVKGDPGDRRRFLDELAVQRTPRYAGTRADFDRVLRQRNTLLKTARQIGNRETAVQTLGVWDAHLARLGGEILSTRLALVEELRPEIGRAYAAVARGATHQDAAVEYAASVDLPDSRDPHELTEALLAGMAERRSDELDRGVSLVGPHRDELRCQLGDLPVKGYASHGECWSFALALRLASYAILRSEGDDPVLILDDVFAELDSGRRRQLAELVGEAEQVLVTAAVPEDVPEALHGVRFVVSDGHVSRETADQGEASPVSRESADHG